MIRTQLNFEAIDIGGGRDAAIPENALVAQLREGAEIIGDVEVAVEQNPFQLVAAGGRRLDAVIDIDIIFMALADFAGKQNVLGSRRAP